MFLYYFIILDVNKQKTPINSSRRLIWGTLLNELYNYIVSDMYYFPIFTTK